MRRRCCGHAPSTTRGHGAGGDADDHLLGAAVRERAAVPGPCEGSVVAEPWEERGVAGLRGGVEETPRGGAGGGAAM